MGLLSLLTGGSVEGIVNSVGGVVKTIFGDKAAKETNVHDEQMSAENAMAAEATAQQRENRSAWDSLVDGISRLPRPLFAFMVIGILVWCPVDPVAFSKAMVSYQLVPDWMALIVGQVILLYCGGRMLSDHFDMRAKDPKNVAAVLGQIKEIQAIQTAKAIEKPITNSQFQKEMADTSKPLSLTAIEEWNKRKGNK